MSERNKEADVKKLLCIGLVCVIVAVLGFITGHMGFIKLGKLIVVIAMLVGVPSIFVGSMIAMTLKQDKPS